MHTLIKIPAFLATLILFASQTLKSGEEPPVDLSAHNSLTYAVAWKQTAAEFRALYYQGFNIARMQVEHALSRHDNLTENKPLAIVSDVDETLLLSNDYWGYLIHQGGDFFDDASWDEWIPTNRSFPSPGALEFAAFCEANNVSIFYVTSRNQGEPTFEYAMGNLKEAGFPNVDKEHLTVLRESSNKQIIQDKISENYEIVLFLGDNLNDFRRKYYSKDVDERTARMKEDKAFFGTKYILFPNPTDGHWIRAIFGESEPPASDENRAILKAAATSQAWDGN